MSAPRPSPESSTVSPRRAAPADPRQSAAIRSRTPSAGSASGLKSGSDGRGCADGKTLHDPTTQTVLATSRPPAAVLRSRSDATAEGVRAMSARTATSTAPTAAHPAGRHPASGATLSTIAMSHSTSAAGTTPNAAARSPLQSSTRPSPRNTAPEAAAAASIAARMWRSGARSRTWTAAVVVHQNRANPKSTRPAARSKAGPRREVSRPARPTSVGASREP